VRALPPLAFENERVVRVRGGAAAEQAGVHQCGLQAFCPARFTLTQMQRVYEAILGEPMDKRNFRRRVVGLSIVRETGQTLKLGAHRPAMLYEFISREPMTL